MADRSEVEDQILRRNEKLAKRGGSYTNTLEEAIAGSQEHFDKIDAYDKQFEEGKCVGGYSLQQMRNIMKVDLSVQPEASLNNHHLLERIREEFTDSEITKDEAYGYKHWYMELINTDTLTIEVEIKRISTASMICYFKKTEMVKKFKFASETDKTVVPYMKPIVEEWKDRAYFTQPKRYMLRMIDRLICSHKIPNHNAVELQQQWGDWFR